LRPDEEITVVYELLFLFFARTIDMSLATIRQVLVIRGQRWAAGLIGFFEIMVFTLALGLVVSAGTDIWRLLAFSLGFGTGIILGVTIEDTMAFGYRLVLVTIDKKDEWIAGELRRMGHAVTVMDAAGQEGAKVMLNMVMRRRRAREIAAEITRRVPSAFVVATEPKHFLGGKLL
jgi:uncharacterized protein YebE (UPF0316 family)